MYLTEGLAKFIASTEYSSLPEEVRRIAEERLMDTAGAMLAGCSDWVYTEELLRAMDHLGRGSIAVVGQRSAHRYPAARAAMINAAFAHAIELDDGHKNAGIHAGAAAVSTALALGEETGADGKAVLTAIVIGYEIAYRLAAAQSPDLIRRGFHPSAVCDTLGAMAAAGKLLGLTEKQLAAGLGMAALQAAGLMEATVSGQQSKCIMVGNAVFAGIGCAYTAREGIEGCLSALEGKSGLFKAMSRESAKDGILEGLGSTYLIGDTYSKLYPTCRHAQPAIEAVLNLMEKQAMGPAAIEEVEVGTHRVAYDLTGRIKIPRTAGEAKFSIPYGVAAAILDKTVSVSHLKEKAYRDPKYLAVANKVKVFVDPAVDALYPKKRGARVLIRLKDGRELQEECYDLKGSPQNPIDLKELTKKFTDIGQSLLPPETVSAILTRCGAFEKEKDIASFTELLRWS